METFEGDVAVCKENKRSYRFGHNSFDRIIDS